MTVSLINQEIALGNGSAEMYSSSTGQLGDFDGDGFVSTSDLLTFLTEFGTGTTIEDNLVDVTRLGFDPDQGFGLSEGRFLRLVLVLYLLPMLRLV